MTTLTIQTLESGSVPHTVDVGAASDTTIGRARENVVVLSDDRVSRKHAVISPVNGKFVLIDCGSSFGTFLNGEKLEHGAPAELRNCDRIDVGDCVLAYNDDGGQACDEEEQSRRDEGGRGEEGNRGERPYQELSAFYTDEMMALKRRIHECVLTRLNLPEIASAQMQNEELRAKLHAALDTALRELKHEFPRDLSQAMFREHLLDELIGYGPISPMLRDPEVDEIMVNGPSAIFVERKGILHETGVRFFDNRHVLTIVQRVVEPLGRHVDEASPMVDARLPDGSRVNVVVPPLALDGPIVTVRKFASRKLTTDDMIEFGTMTREMARFLEEAVRARQNILVSGGTGSGKTTLLNVLSQFIPLCERMVTIEDSAELRLSHRNLVRLEARPANIEGRGRVAIRDLVVNALRMRPDRVIVGECRGGEALDMLQAMNTGHDGSLTTIHANNPRDALSRLENMVMMAGFELPSTAIRDQIASAVDLVIHQSRLVDGSRKITQISEITGKEGNIVLMQDIFTFEQKGFTEKGQVVGRFVATGNIPRFVEELKQKGDMRLDLGVFVPPA